MVLFLMSYTDDEIYEMQERAGILEFEALIPRKEAESIAASMAAIRRAKYGAVRVVNGGNGGVVADSDMDADDKAATG